MFNFLYSTLLFFFLIKNNFNLDNISQTYNTTLLFINREWLLILIATTLHFISTANKKSLFSHILFIFVVSKLSQHSFEFENLNNAILIGLNNRLSMFHPFLVVLTISIYFFNANMFYYSTVSIKIKYNKLLLLVVGMSLILGSWWSAQEVLWGGWWNWDLVETSLLFIFIGALIFVHGNKKPFTLFNFTKIIVFFIVSFIVFSWTNHTPLVTSVHSFVSGNGMFVTPVQIIIPSVFTILLFVKKNSLANISSIYFLTVFYIMFVKYSYKWISNITISNDFLISKNFVISLPVYLIVQTRRCKNLVFYSIVSSLVIKIGLLLFLINPILSYFLGSLNFYLYSIKCKKTLQNHIPFVFLLVVYLSFFMSNSLFAGNSVFFENILVSNNCTLFKYMPHSSLIYQDTDLKFIVKNSIINKVYFLWFNSNGISLFNTYSFNKINGLLSNFF